MTHNTARRLCRLESRLVTNGPRHFSVRILLVNPELGLTGVMVIDDDNPITRDAGTPEEIERVRANLDRRRAAHLQWEGGLHDTHDLATA